MPRPDLAERRRSSARYLTGIAIVVVWATLYSPAVCAESDKTVARAHYETATRLYDLREYSKALDEYKAAYLAKPDPAFLFNIGQCFRKLGNTTSAMDFYQQYLKKIPAEDPGRIQAEARIRDIQLGRESEDDPFAKPGEKDVLISQPIALPASPPEPPLPPKEATSPSPLPLPASSASTPPPEADRRLELTSPRSAQVLSSPSIYSTWWFWTGVGSVVVAGTVTAIVLSKGGSEPNIATTTLGTQAAFP